MRKSTVRSLLICVLILSSAIVHAQTVLIDYNFQAAPYPDGLTTDGTFSPTKAADGVCSKGMVQVNAGQYLQVDISSCSLFVLNMKSTSSSARSITIKARKKGEASFTTLGNISVSTAASFNLTQLFPALVYNDSVSMRLEAGGNTQVHDILVQANGNLNHEANITSFKLSGMIGSELVDTTAATVLVNMPMGTALNAVIPSSITLSAAATISPASTAAQNFSGGAAVHYTVTAQDGATKNWTVTVAEIASSAKNILSFKLNNSQIGNAQIDTLAGTVSVLVPIGTSLTSIVPSTITVSPYASLVPDASTARDFSSPVTYTVRAQDNSTTVFTVTVTAVDPAALFTDYEAEQANFTGKTDNQHAGYSGTGFVDFLTAGENQIIFSVCQQESGVRQLKFRYALGKVEDRTAQLIINDIPIGNVAFPPTSSFTDWQEVMLTANLNAGVNKIKLAWPSTDGPNLDKLSVSGLPCNSFIVNTTVVGGGAVSLSPTRYANRYFEGETVTLAASGPTGINFVNWSGDTSSTSNPLHVVVYKDFQVQANFQSTPVYALTVVVNGVGQVVRTPEANSYEAGTVVQLEAKSVLGSTFTGWSGDASGSNAVIQLVMNANKSVTASFNSSYTPNFSQVVGFASVAGDGFSGPTNGGGAALDTLIINGPAEFNKLCEAMYYRGRAYTNGTTTNGYKKAPLVVVLKAGVYDGTQTLSTDGAKAFGNSMLDIPEQGEITMLGDCNVIFKIGFNVKRSWNVLIRNISFYDYNDDAINVGYPETHHIWIDHCTFGNPTTIPANKEIPDGTTDIKDGASYVTISWCKYQHHWKTSLVGHSDNNGATDAGRLKVTYYANYFFSTNSRHPRVRFGQVHVLNNLYENAGLGREGDLGYGIAASNNSQVFAEANFFVDTRWPMLADRTAVDFAAVYGPNLESPTGNKPCFGLRAVRNEYDDAGLTATLDGKVSPAMLNPGNMSIRFDTLVTSNFNFDPALAYNYESFLLPASAVRILVPMYAGADKLGGGACVLPVSLLSFEGKNTQSGNQLLWVTTQESNMAFYRMERSTDGRSFSGIADVPALNAAGNARYNWLDRNAPKGSVYYRLAMVNKDGSKMYSGIIRIDGVVAGTLQVISQSTVAMQVRLPAATSGKSALSIYGSDGRLLQQQKVPSNASIVSIDLHALPTGVYWLNWVQDGKSYGTKFMHW